MLVLKSTFNREVSFWRDRAETLETKLEAESRRNRKREDALLNRVLTHSAHTYAITEDEIDPVPPLPEPPNPALIEMEDTFNKWAIEAGVSDHERKRQWLILSPQYSNELG